MAVTAYAAKGDEERIREAGAEGYVSKPISVIRFVEAVRALLAAPRPEPAQEEEEHDIRVERAFAAPAERVFDAWLDPETVGDWLFRTADGTLVRCEVEPEVGGRYAIVERRGDEEVLHTGVYEEIERPDRLVFTLAVPLYADREERVAIDIRPSEEGCTLTLTQTRAADAPASREQIARGWAALLDSLAVRVEREQGSSD
jgi:uncharacterized protein YndB with AHSA1/START domain